MEVYNNKDLIAFNESIKDIIDKVKIAQLETFEPTKHEIDKVMGIINKFVKDNNRKVYGGYALNLLLKSKNRDDAIYNDIEFADIDFYSPEPIKDLIELSNLLYDAGFKEPFGKEAQHPETYSIIVNQMLYCDITYVPKNIYNRLPFTEIENFKVIHPHFMMIDFFRMFTDPLSSYWRLEKTIPRFYKLQKHYPLLKIKTDIKTDYIDNDTYNSVVSIFKNRDDIIIIGGYSYNCFLKEAGNNNIKPIKNPPIEVLLINYETIGNEIKRKLKEIDKDFKFIEHYPFFQFTTYSCKVYHKDTLIMVMQGTNNKCYPYSKIKLNKNDFIYIGSFDLTLLYCMINTVIYRTLKEIKYMNNYQRMISDLIDMRNNFFNNNKNKKMVDDTLFKSFQVECIGKSKDPIREFREKISERKKNKSGPLIYKYEPHVSRKEPESNFIFSNISGNAINNVKNLKLT